MFVGVRGASHTLKGRPPVLDGPRAGAFCTRERLHAGWSGLPSVSRPPATALWEDSNHATDEAGFETKAPEGCGTGVGSCWRVSVAGGRRIGKRRGGGPTT